MFAEMEFWKIVNDIDRRDIFDDVVQQLAKRERVSSQSNHCLLGGRVIGQSGHFLLGERVIAQ